jgi:serine phosphatase RsbU (regulator of sigma subunit)
MVKSALRLQLQHDPSPTAVLSHVNNTIYQLADEKTFVTFAYALIDRTGNTARLATAGHPPILYLEHHTSSIRWCRESNLALGMRPNVPFSFSEIPLASGDRLVLYTDGLLEAENPSGDQFGADRLEEAARNSYASVDDFCAALTTAVRRFSGREAFEDDLTIVCAQIT